MYINKIIMKKNFKKRVVVNVLNKIIIIYKMNENTLTIKNE